MNNAQLGSLSMLLGGKISGLARSGQDDGDDELFGLIVTDKNNERKVIWFFSDFEGNGAGGFEIIDYNEGDELP